MIEFHFHLDFRLSSFTFEIPNTLSCTFDIPLVPFFHMAVKYDRTKLV